jgi:hypothetical protein
MVTFSIEHSIIVEDVVRGGMLLQVEILHSTVPYDGGCLGKIFTLKDGGEGGTVRGEWI